MREKIVEMPRMENWAELTHNQQKSKKQKKIGPKQMNWRKVNQTGPTLSPQVCEARNL